MQTQTGLGPKPAFLTAEPVDLRTKSNSVHRKLVLPEVPRDRRILQGQGPAPLLTEGSVQGTGTRMSIQQLERQSRDRNQSPLETSQ